MKSFLKKIEYSLLVLFVALQTQVPFVVIQQFKEGKKGFSILSIECGRTTMKGS